MTISLPLTDQETYAHPFFSGLLPEGGVRQRLCRQLGIDSRDDVGLLFAVGKARILYRQSRRSGSGDAGG